MNHKSFFTKVIACTLVIAISFSDAIAYSRVFSPSYNPNPDTFHVKTPAAAYRMASYLRGFGEEFPAFGAAGSFRRPAFTRSAIRDPNFKSRVSGFKSRGRLKIRNARPEPQASRAELRNQEKTIERKIKAFHEQYVRRFKKWIVEEKGKHGDKVANLDDEIQSLLVWMGTIAYGHENFRKIEAEKGQKANEWEMLNSMNTKDFVSELVAGMIAAEAQDLMRSEKGPKLLSERVQRFVEEIDGPELRARVNHIMAKQGGLEMLCDVDFEIDLTGAAELQAVRLQKMLEEHSDELGLYRAFYAYAWGFYVLAHYLNERRISLLLPLWKRYGPVTVDRVLQRFEQEFLREHFPRLRAELRSPDRQDLDGVPDTLVAGKESFPPVSIEIPPGTAEGSVAKSMSKPRLSADAGEPSPGTVRDSGQMGLMTSAQNPIGSGVAQPGPRRSPSPPAASRADLRSLNSLSAAKNQSDVALWQPALAKKLRNQKDVSRLTFKEIGKEVHYGWSWVEFVLAERQPKTQAQWDALAHAIHVLIGPKLKQRREAMRLSIRKLAAESRIKEKRIREVESGSRVTNKEILLLHKTMDRLLPSQMKNYIVSSGLTAGAVEKEAGITHNRISSFVIGRYLPKTIEVVERIFGAVDKLRSKKLRRVRKSGRLSQQAVAAGAGLSNQLVGKVESAGSGVPLGTLSRVRVAAQKLRGAQLKARRNAARLTQQQLAKHMGVRSFQYVSEMERGKFPKKADSAWQRANEAVDVLQGPHLKDRRESLGLSREEVAQEARLTKGQIYNMETGEAIDVSESFQRAHEAMDRLGGKRLREKQEALRLNQAELATLLGVTQGYLLRVEKGVWLGDIETWKEWNATVEQLLGKRLHERRRAFRLSFREVAKRSGISVSTISGLESGNQHTDLATWKKLHETLDELRGPKLRERRLEVEGLTLAQVAEAAGLRDYHLVLAMEQGKKKTRGLYRQKENLDIWERVHAAIDANRLANPARVFSVSDFYGSVVGTDQSEMPVNRLIDKEERVEQVARMQRIRDVLPRIQDEETRTILSLTLSGKAPSTIAGYFKLAPSKVTKLLALGIEECRRLILGEENVAAQQTSDSHQNEGQSLQQPRSELRSKPQVSIETLEPSGSSAAGIDVHRDNPSKTGTAPDPKRTRAELRQNRAGSRQPDLRQPGAKSELRVFSIEEIPFTDLKDKIRAFEQSVQKRLGHDFMLQFSGFDPIDYAILAQIAEFRPSIEELIKSLKSKNKPVALSGVVFYRPSAGEKTVHIEFAPTGESEERPSVDIPAHANGYVDNSGTLFINVDAISSMTHSTLQGFYRDDDVPKQVAPQRSLGPANAVTQASPRAIPQPKVPIDPSIDSLSRGKQLRTQLQDVINYLLFWRSDPRSQGKREQIEWLLERVGRLVFRQHTYTKTGEEQDFVWLKIDMTSWWKLLPIRALQVITVLPFLPCYLGFASVLVFGGLARIVIFFENGWKFPEFVVANNFEWVLSYAPVYSLFASPAIALLYAACVPVTRMLSEREATLENILDLLPGIRDLEAPTSESNHPSASNSRAELRRGYEGNMMGEEREINGGGVSTESIFQRQPAKRRESKGRTPHRRQTKSDAFQPPFSGMRSSASDESNVTTYKVTPVAKIGKLKPSDRMKEPTMSPAKKMDPAFSRNDLRVDRNLPSSFMENMISPKAGNVNKNHNLHDGKSSILSFRSELRSDDSQLLSSDGQLTAGKEAIGLNGLLRPVAGLGQPEWKIVQKNIAPGFSIDLLQPNLTGDQDPRTPNGFTLEQTTERFERAFYQELKRWDDDAEAVNMTRAGFFAYLNLLINFHIQMRDRKRVKQLVSFLKQPDSSGISNRLFSPFQVVPLLRVAKALSRISYPDVIKIFPDDMRSEAFKNVRSVREQVILDIQHILDQAHGNAHADSVSLDAPHEVSVHQIFHNFFIGATHFVLTFDAAHRDDAFFAKQNFEESFRPRGLPIVFEEQDPDWLHGPLITAKKTSLVLTLVFYLFALIPLSYLLFLARRSVFDSACFFAIGMIMIHAIVPALAKNFGETTNWLPMLLWHAINRFKDIRLMRNSGELIELIQNELAQSGEGWHENSVLFDGVPGFSTSEEMGDSSSKIGTVAGSLTTGRNRAELREGIKVGVFDGAAGVVPTGMKLRSRASALSWQGLFPKSRIYSPFLPGYTITAVIINSVADRIKAILRTEWSSAKKLLANAAATKIYSRFARIPAVNALLASPQNWFTGALSMISYCTKKFIKVNEILMNSDNTSMSPVRSELRRRAVSRISDFVFRHQEQPAFHEILDTRNEIRSRAELRISEVRKERPRLTNKEEISGFSGGVSDIGQSNKEPQPSAIFQLPQSQRIQPSPRNSSESFQSPFTGLEGHTIIATSNDTISASPNTSFSSIDADTEDFRNLNVLHSVDPEAAQALDQTIESIRDVSAPVPNFPASSVEPFDKLRVASKSRLRRDASRPRGADSKDRIFLNAKRYTLPASNVMEQKQVAVRLFAEGFTRNLGYLYREVLAAIGRKEFVVIHVGGGNKAGLEKDSIQKLIRGLPGSEFVQFVSTPEQIELLTQEFHAPRLYVHGYDGANSNDRRLLEQLERMYRDPANQETELKPDFFLNGGEVAERFGFTLSEKLLEWEGAWQANLERAKSA